MKQAKTKFLALLLAVAMVVGMLPATSLSVFAAETNVAKIGQTEYATLQAAMEAAVATEGAVTVELLADISGEGWTSIAFDSYPAQNADSITLDGNNHTITGLTAPLIGSVWTGTSLTIQDLTVSGANINETGNYGAALIAVADSIASINLKNCHVKNSTIQSANYTAGLIGWCSGYANENDGPVHMYVTIEGCSVTGSTITGGGSTGALIGHAGCSNDTTISVTACTIGKNTLTCTDESYGRPDKVGAAIGRINNGDVTFSITDDGGNTLRPQGNYPVRLLGSVVGGSMVISGGEYISDPRNTEKVSDSILAGNAPSLADGCVLKANGNTYTVEKYYAAQIGSTKYETLAEAVAAAADGDIITLSDGTHTLPKISNRSLTFAGTRAAVIDMTNAVTATDCSLTFDGVTLAFTQNSYRGIQHTAKEIYKNCAITGLQTLYAPSVEFTNCEFTNLEGYNLWTYGAEDVTFSGCTFYSGGRCVYVYNEKTNISFTANISFTNCEFNDNDSQKEDNGSDDLEKGAVETGSIGKNGETANRYNITFVNCSANGFHVNTTENRLWGNKHTLDADHLKVWINGVYMECFQGHTWDNGVETIAPTAEKTGIKTYTCTVNGCGITKTEVIAATHTHAYTTINPTCTTGGYQICSCGYVNKDENTKTAATGHSYTDVVTNPTCTAQGYTTHTCSACGYSYKDTPVAATYHTPTTKRAVAATCTATGLTEGSHCSVCNATVIAQKVVPAKGHTWDTGTTSEAGITTFTCTVDGCNATKQTLAQHTHSYTATVYAKTCTTDGYTLYKCTCGDNYTVIDTATGHTMASVDTAPTCTAQGYTTHTCSVCGHSYNDSYTAAKGHAWGTGVVTLDPTADANGVKLYMCACGTTKTEAIPKLGHVFTSKYVAPTCTEKGYMEHTCTTCQNGTHTYRDSYVDAIGHTMKDDVKAPTCTTKGYTTHTCSACGYSIIDNYVAAHGHSWTGTVTKAPASNSDGEMTYTCGACGATKTEKIAALGHTFTAAVTHPTCTEQGYTTYTCITCTGSAHTYVSDYVPAKGHTLASVVTAPTCTAKGYTTHTCTVGGCGYTLKSAYTDMIAHNYVYSSTVAATADTEGKLVYKCYCGAERIEVIPALGHKFTSAVTKAATCEAEGVITYTCSTCRDADKSHTYTEVIPAKSHTWVAGTAVPASCTAGGYTPYTCTCGAKRNANHTPMTEHTFNSNGACTADGCTATDVSKAEDLVGKAEKVTTDIAVEIAGFSSKEEIKAAMEAAGNIAASNVTSTLYDISLSVGETALTANNFPEDGHVFEIPLPTGVSIADVTVSHMITETYNGNMAGDIEILDHWPSEDGKNICFRTYSTSPVMLSIVTEQKGDLHGTSLTLDGKIGINFYMKLDPTVVQDQNAYMQFTLPNGTTMRVKASEAVPTERSSVTYYVFTAPVSAPEMTEDVTAQFISDAYTSEVFTKSVAGYAKNILSNPSTSEEDTKIIKAMLNYGAAAQVLFNHITHSLANEQLDAADKTVAELTSVDFGSFTKSSTDNLDGISYHGTSTVLESNTVIRHYFTLDADANINDYIFAADNKTLTPVARDGMYYVDIEDIGAHELDKMFELVVTKASQSSGNLTVKYSVYTYISSMNSNNSSTSALKNLVKAAYGYSQAVLATKSQGDNN